MPAVLANGRTLVHKSSQGILKTSSVNWTPPMVPVSYTNIAKSEDAAGTSARTQVEGNPICHKESFFAKSKGDEHGSIGGIKSGTVNGKAEFLSWSSDVMVEGKPVVREKDTMISNCKNTDTQPLKQPGASASAAKINQSLEAVPDAPLPNAFCWEKNTQATLQIAGLLMTEEAV